MRTAAAALEAVQDEEEAIESAYKKEAERKNENGGDALGNS